MTSPDPPRRDPERSTALPVETVDLDQFFDRDSLYTLRAALAAHASRVGATDDQIDHLLIVAGELAINAIRHGGGTGRLRLWHHDQTLYCQISDQGPGISGPTTLGTTQPDPASSDSGRGIWICRNLTTELTITNGPDGHGTIVTAVIPAPGHRPPPGNDPPEPG